MLVKIDILAVDETKHVLLFIFHALYMCVTIRDYMQTKRNLKINKYHRYACYIFWEIIITTTDNVHSYIQSFIYIYCRVFILGLVAMGVVAALLAWMHAMHHANS